MRNIHKKVSEYYSDKIIKHGSVPSGVDWNGTESQHLRFKVLSNIIDYSIDFSILDFGCGYGAYLDYLNKNAKVQFQYYGLDISDDMLLVAKKNYEGLQSCATWIKEIPVDFAVDYTISSGIFNVKLDEPVEAWEKYCLETLNKINAISKKGFSFNMLTSYSDAEYMKKYLYYAMPEKIFEHCMNTYSKKVCLEHSYPLYEFSIMVKK